MIYRVTKNENNEKTLEQLTGGVGSGLPLGTVIAIEGDILPAGYLWCDGSTFDTDKYPALYMLLGSNKTPEIYDTNYIKDSVGWGANSAATADGICSLYAASGGNASFSVYLRNAAGANVYSAGTSTGQAKMGGGFSAPVKKGYTWTYSVSGNSAAWGNIAYYYRFMAIKAVSGYEADQENTLFKLFVKYNELSDFEDVTIPTTAATAMTAEYDGELYLTTPSWGYETVIHYYINGVTFDIGLVHGVTTSVIIPIKKGDTFYSSFTPTQSKARWYKHRG